MFNDALLSIVVLLLAGFAFVAWFGMQRFD